MKWPDSAMTSGDNYQSGVMRNIRVFRPVSAQRLWLSESRPKPTGAVRMSDGPGVDHRGHRGRSAL
ncbi:hypothetical protein GCM10029978_117020 [Actinoallomurus acanthiterrae]